MDLHLPRAGSTIDRIGVRRAVIPASIGLGLVLACLSQVDRIALRIAGAGIPALTPATASFCFLSVGFLGLRFSGQGALTLICRIMLGRWFARKRGLVSSISAPFASFAFASSPLVLGAWVSGSGWRNAWLEMAFVVGVGMAAFGWLFFRESPEECGLEMDGASRPRAPEAIAAESKTTSRRDFTRSEAIRTAAFWIVTLAIANHAMVGTGIAHHIVDLGAESGLTETDALRIFLPVTLISIPTGIIMGLFIDRFPMRFLIMGMMVGQMLMFGLVPHLDKARRDELAR